MFEVIYFTYEESRAVEQKRIPAQTVAIRTGKEVGYYEQNQKLVTLLYDNIIA